MSGTTAKKAHVWARDPYDWYVEPELVTRQLLTVERFVGRVLDPCCGQGNIVRTLIDCGVVAKGSDIVCRAPGENWFLGERDFLQSQVVGWANIIMNPPFFRAKGTEAFIRHALTQASSKVAAFVPLNFLASEDRALGLYAEHRPHRGWIVTPRVSCPPGTFLIEGGRARGDQRDWCWLVWDLTAPPAAVTSFDWLRRSHG